MKLDLTSGQLIRMYLSLAVIMAVFGFGLTSGIGWTWSLLATFGTVRLFNITLNAILDYYAK